MEGRCAAAHRCPSQPYSIKKIDFRSVFLAEAVFYRPAWMRPRPLHRKAFSYVGANLRVGRVTAGLTQEALAELVGVDTTYIQAIERGATNFTISVLLDVALAIGADPGMLFKPVAVEARKTGRPKAPAKKKS